jgi:integrase
MPKVSQKEPKKAKDAKFERVGECLYRYVSKGTYYAKIRHEGRLIWRSLKTINRSQAKRKLADLRAKLERVDHSAGKMTLEQLCRDYLATLSQSPKTMEGKEAIVERVIKDWPAVERAQCQLRNVKPGDVSRWLAGYDFGAASYNAYLWFVRSAFDYAVANRLLADNPARDTRAKKREAPIRHTPTFEQFQAIVKEVRGQKKNARAKKSADLIEFMGLAGVGNAEARNLTWKDIDFEKGKITLFRQKTRRGYQIPLFPQVGALLKRLRGRKAPDGGKKVFETLGARKSMAGACERLKYPHFDHRSLRRMFVTRALQRGVDVKTVAAWQGHQDGGRLILSTYSHVLSEHSDRMAKLMTL